MRARRVCDSGVGLGIGRGKEILADVARLFLFRGKDVLWLSSSIPSCSSLPHTTSSLNSWRALSVPLYC